MRKRRISEKENRWHDTESIKVTESLTDISGNCLSDLIVDLSLSLYSFCLQLSVNFDVSIAWGIHVMLSILSVTLTGDCDVRELVWVSGWSWTSWGIDRDAFPSHVPWLQFLSYSCCRHPWRKGWEGDTSLPTTQPEGSWPSLRWWEMRRWWLMLNKLNNLKRMKGMMDK